MFSSIFYYDPLSYRDGNDGVLYLFKQNEGGYIWVLSRVLFLEK